MDQYLKIGEAADRLGVNSETLRRWDKTGKFKSTRHPINNYRVYPEHQILSFVEELQMEMKFGPKNKEQFASYFKTNLGCLYKVDALRFLKNLDDESVDLIFADPPYNIRKAEWDTFSSQKEYVEWSITWIKEASRVLTKNGSLFICGFSEILADLKWASSPFFEGCKWLIWYYRNKANLGNDWGRSHESILHLRKTKNFFFDVDAVRVPYNEHTLKYPTRTQAESSQFSKGKKKNYVWEPNPLGAKPKDVIEIPTISNGAWEKMEHPTQKPVELLRKIILSSSRKNDLILDPFGGSGTTFAVAEAYQRKWIGTELDVNYCKVIKKRLSDKSLIKRITTGLDSIESQNRRVKLRG